MARPYNQLVLEFYSRVRHYDIPCYIQPITAATPTVIAREQERIRLQREALRTVSYTSILDALAEETDVPPPEEAVQSKRRQWSSYMGLVSRERGELHDILRAAENELQTLRLQ